MTSAGFITVSIISVIQFISNNIVKSVQYIINHIVTVILLITIYIVTIVGTAVRWRRASRDTLSQRSLSASDASVAIRVTLFK